MNEDLRRYIEKLIDDCNYYMPKKEYIQLIKTIVTVFNKEIPDITDELKTYSQAIENCSDSDYRDDLEILQHKLKYYLLKQSEYKEEKNTNNELRQFIINANSTNTVNPTITSNSTNTNTQTQNQTVHNTLDIKVELDKVRAEVEADEVLGDEDKEEINEKLNEIEEVMNGSQTNNEKWKKLKGVVNWVTTKGFKIGKMIMPLITKALFPEE